MKNINIKDIMDAVDILDRSAQLASMTRSNHAAAQQAANLLRQFVDEVDKSQQPRPVNETVAGVDT